jgi:membrane protease YdiL (CAAX protease family)
LERDTAILPPGLTMLAIVLLAVFFGRPFDSFAGEWGFWQSVQGIFLVTVVGFVALAISKAILPAPVVDTEDHEIYQGTWGAVFLYVAGIGPLYEELIFRYCIMGALYVSSPVWAVALSGILFGIVHKHYKFAKIIKGVGYAWLYVMSGTIWVPFAAHALWNFICVCVMKSVIEERQRRRWLMNFRR